MNIHKYRDRKTIVSGQYKKAFRKECIKEYRRLYYSISDYMNDGYSEYSFKMKGTRSETVAILALLCRFAWLSGDFMNDWGMDERLGYG